LKAKIGDTVSRADAAKKILDIPALENKIKIAFGDDELFSKYASFMTNEKELFRAVTDVLSNSKTAERGLAAAESALDPGILVQAGSDIGRGNLIQGLFNLSKGFFQKVTSSQPRAEGIAKTLTGRNIEGLQPGPVVTRITEQLAPRSAEDVFLRALAPQAGVNQP